jgi:RNA polymerase sigma factor (sigma-70 family)
MGTPIMVHVRANLKWWVFKWMNTRSRDKVAHGQDITLLQVEAPHSSLNLDASDQVEQLLEGLTQEERNLLEMYHVQGLTFVEIGAVLGFSKATAVRRYHTALKHCQRNAKHSDESL